MLRIRSQPAFGSAPVNKSDAACPSLRDSPVPGTLRWKNPSNQNRVDVSQHTDTSDGSQAPGAQKAAKKAAKFRGQRLFSVSFIEAAGDRRAPRTARTVEADACRRRDWKYRVGSDESDTGS